jgi:hypothetical protein
VERAIGCQRARDQPSGGNLQQDVPRVGEAPIDGGLWQAYESHFLHIRNSSGLMRIPAIVTAQIGIVTGGSVDVLRDLVESEAFHAFATLEILRGLILRDVEIASAIALSCDRYVKVARVELVAALMEHPDPAVADAARRVR